MIETQKDKISIIVPVYNAEKYLARCIDSLINQTYSNIEILLINDGSQDNSLNIIIEYAEKYSQIRFFKQKNAGPATTRNIGLDNASGEYIMFCDSDDAFEPSMCEDMLLVMHDQQVDLVMCNIYLHHKKGSVVPKEQETFWFALRKGRYVSGSPALRNMNIMVWNKIFKRSIILDFGIKFPDRLSTEDSAFIYQYMSVIDSAYMLNKPLYNYFVANPYSVTYKFSGDQIKISDLLDKVSILGFTYNFMTKHNVFDKNREYFAFRFKETFLYIALNLGEAWESTVFDKAGNFLRKVNMDNWGDLEITSMVRHLRNGEHAKAIKNIKRLLGNRYKQRRVYLGQEFPNPAFTKNNIAVFFNGSDDSAPYLSTSMQSVIKNATADYNYDIIILHNDISGERKNILKNMICGYTNFSLRFFHMGSYEKKYNLQARRGFLLYNDNDDKSPLFYSLFAPLIFKYYDRVIYLNNNLIINTDIAELHAIPFENKSALAVPDFIAPNQSYFNAGMMVFNLKKMRDMDYHSLFLKLCGNITLKQHDQDILNHVLEEDVLLIDTLWNYQVYPESSAVQLNDQFKIIHYCDSDNNPWKNQTAMRSELWWSYACKTPFHEYFIKMLEKREKKLKNQLNLFLTSAFEIMSLKASFYRYRLLSKITLGKTRMHYAHKKTTFRNRIKELRKTKNYSDARGFSLFIIMQNFVRQRHYVFFDCLYSKITEEIDAFSLFEYCQNNNIPAKYIARKDGFLHKKMNGVASRDIIYIEDPKSKFLIKELFFILIRARALITSFGGINCNLEKMLVGSKKTEYIFIGHGPTFFKTAICKTGYLSPKRYNRLLISSVYEKELMTSCGWQEDQLISVGFPRWDKLNKAMFGAKSKKVFIFFTWRVSFNNAATYIHNFKYPNKISEFLQSNRLEEINKKYGVEFRIAFHHALLNQCGVDFRPLAGGNIKLVSNDDISRCIMESDMLITDYSSIFMDFFFQNKPAIFYRFDEDDENLETGDKADFASAALQTRRVFNVFYDTEDVFDRLEYYIQHHFRPDEDEQIKMEKFFYEKEDICAKIMEQISGI